jgi:hypothetical protein
LFFANNNQSDQDNEDEMSKVYSRHVENENANKVWGKARRKETNRKT